MNAPEDFGVEQCQFYGEFAFFFSNSKSETASHSSMSWAYDRSSVNAQFMISHVVSRSWSVAGKIIIILD